MIYKYSYKTFSTLRFQRNQIKRIEECVGYKIMFHKIKRKDVFIYIPETKNYIYTNDEAIIEYNFNRIQGKCYFPYLNLNLIKKYYEKKESIYIDEKRVNNKILFDKKQVKEEFRLSEIKWAENFNIFEQENYVDIHVILKYYENNQGYKIIHNQVSEYLKWLTTPYYAKNLEDLFKKKYINIIIILMREIKIIDSDNRCLLGIKNMAPLSALINYLDASKQKFELLTVPHTKKSSSYLLSYFNRHLGTTYKTVSTKGSNYSPLYNTVNQYFTDYFSN